MFFCSFFFTPPYQRNIKIEINPKLRLLNCRAAVLRERLQDDGGGAAADREDASGDDDALRLWRAAGGPPQGHQPHHRLPHRPLHQVDRKGCSCWQSLQNSNSSPIDMAKILFWIAEHTLVGQKGKQARVSGCEFNRLKSEMSERDERFGAERRLSSAHALLRGVTYMQWMMMSPWKTQGANDT